MDVRLHSRNTVIDDRFRQLAIDKISHAGRVFDTDGTVDVEITEEGNPRRSDDRFKLEITGPFGGRIVRISTAAATPEAALDDAVDRFTKRLRRLKEKLIDSHRKSEGAIPEPEPENRREEVFRVKQFAMKPMTIEEATLQMEMLGHDFFFFLNGANDKQSVLYRRRDGRLGLIEPA